MPSSFPSLELDFCIWLKKKMAQLTCYNLPQFKSFRLELGDFAANFGEGGILIITILSLSLSLPPRSLISLSLPSLPPSLPSLSSNLKPSLPPLPALPGPESPDMAFRPRPHGAAARAAPGRRRRRRAREQN